MKRITVKSLLEEKLVVGAKVRYGVRFAEDHFCKAGDVITLVEGYFERENGLYTSTERCPAEWDNETKEFSSIYHIWGNELEDFMDCEILEEEYAQQSQPSPAGAAEGIKCKCPDNIKHGQTSVMCCNHCGLPDEDFWNNCG